MAKEKRLYIYYTSGEEAVKRVEDFIDECLEIDGEVEIKDTGKYSFSFGDMKGISLTCYKDSKEVIKEIVMAPISDKKWRRFLRKTLGWS